MYSTTHKRIHHLRVLILSFLAFFVLFGVGESSAAQEGAFPTAPRGEEAISALDSRLEEVATAYGLTAQELAELFRQDNTLSVDRNGELFHIDVAFKGDALLSALGGNDAGSGPVSSMEVLSLESLPGADHTLYLDFDGHVTTGTSWNSGYGVDPIVSPAYSLDSDYANFSATELDRIQKVWEIVAEDFMPFEINVTTIDPGPAALSRSGSGDNQWGVRVVITEDTFANCGCGGHAYIGSFDDHTDEPVFVYNSSELGVSEASSHEVGHSMLLSHDGTDSVTYYTGHGSGETDWAPIMGVSYNSNVSQWDKGEYTGSNNGGSGANYGNGPDDIAIITSLTNGNGFGYRADDHGDSSGSATVLAPSGLNLNGNGIIGRTDDVDVFSFATGAGVVTLTIQPYLRQPNVDVLAQLYDGANNLVASSNPTSSVSASFNLSLAAGTYYLTIDGVGVGNPFANPPTGYTDYGSIGQYTITGTIVDPGGNQPPVAVAAADPTSGPASLVVNFDGSGSSDNDGTITAYSWDFGDSSSGSGALTSHQYDMPGSYVATLTVTDNGGFSSSDSVTINVLEPPPDAPDGLGATGVSESQIDLVWTDLATNENGFEIERRDVDASGSFAVIATVGANGETFSDTGLAASTNYEYRLRAYNGTGYSGYSNTAGAATQDPPPFVDVTASGETMVAGTIAAGSYATTQADDRSAEELRERESGGKPSRRHSSLEHKWMIAVPAGGAARTLFVNAWAPANGEDDRFMLAYSTDDSTYEDMFLVPTADEDPNILQNYVLPTGFSGTVYVRVVDTDQSQGNRGLDSVFVDHLYVRKENAQGDPPAAPANLMATAAGSSQIDLTWDDLSFDEYGFYIERRTESSTFTRVAEVAADVTAFSDGGLDPATTYYYQVQAYNGGGTSAYTPPAEATTGQAPMMYVADMDDTSAGAPRNRWDAKVRIRVTLGDGLTPVSGATIAGVWGGGASGGGECTTDADGWCEVVKGNLKSRVASATFTVTGVTSSGYVYDGTLVDPDGDSSGGIITVYNPLKKVAGMRQDVSGPQS